MTAGRPTKYKPEYPQMLIDFMSGKGEDVIKPIVVDKEIVEHKLGELPNFFEDFAVKIGVTTSTLAEWRNTHQEFSEAYKLCKDIQLSRMVKGSISGAYNSSASIFALKNMAGWRDKQEVEHSGEITLNFDEKDKDA